MVVLQAVEMAFGGVLHVVQPLAVRLRLVSAMTVLAVDLVARDQILLLTENACLMRGQLAAADPGVDPTALVDLAGVDGGNRRQGDADGHQRGRGSEEEFVHAIKLQVS